MAQPSYAPTYLPVSVIDSKYVIPRELDFIVVTNSTGDHLITDANDNTVMFKVKPFHTIFHNQLVLLDPENRVVVILRKKIRSVHNKWNVFMGDDSPNKQRSKGTWDFIVTGSWTNRKCSILSGDSLTTIAQMHPVQLENERFYKDKFKVTVNPNVDGAFVISLIAIIEAMKSSRKDDHHAYHVNDNAGSIYQAATTATPIVGAVAGVVGAVAAVVQVVIS